MAQKEVLAPGTYGDVHYDMAQFGLEKGQNKVASSDSYIADRGTGRPGSPTAARGSGKSGGPRGGEQRT